MNKKVVLELTDSYCYAYSPAEGERIDVVNINSFDLFIDYTTEFATMMAAMIDFNDTYSIIVNNFLQKDDYDTIVIKANIMQFLKKNNTKTTKEFINNISHAYKTIKMAGHRRPDEINYKTDHGAIDNYCAHSLWEAEGKDVRECVYEFSNVSNEEANK